MLPSANQSWGSCSLLGSLGPGRTGVYDAALAELVLNLCTALDVLAVIKELNAHALPAGEGESTRLAVAPRDDASFVEAGESAADDSDAWLFDDRAIEQSLLDEMLDELVSDIASICR